MAHPQAKLIPKNLWVRPDIFNELLYESDVHYLKESIDEILDQISLLDDIELLICDNFSDDGTQILIEEYIQKFPKIIRYVRHQSNLGMDGVVGDEELQLFLMEN